MSWVNLRGSISCPEEKWGISLLYHGCYRSNHGINIYIYMDTNTNKKDK